MKWKELLILILGLLGFVGLLALFWWLYCKFGSQAVAATGTSSLVAGEAVRRKVLKKKEEVVVDVDFVENVVDKSLELGYHAVVERELKRRGPGYFILYRGDEEVKRWRCITGGKVENPAQYGGLTPTTSWVMIEPCKMQRHPTSGSKFRFARIIPIGNKEDWRNRTFEINRWPFMLHIAGSSTGCIAIMPHHWKDFYKTINEIYKKETFVIKVVNKESR